MKTYEELQKEWGNSTFGKRIELFVYDELQKEIAEHKEALKGICDMCDNENPSHEMIWRVAYGALNPVTL